MLVKIENLIENLLNKRLTVEVKEVILKAKSVFEGAYSAPSFFGYDGLSLVIEIPRATPSLNNVIGKKWTSLQKQKKQWHTLVAEYALLIHYKKREAWKEVVKNGKVGLLVVRNSPRLQDPDNVFVKFPIDGLRHAGLISDDTDSDIELTIRQAKATSDSLTLILYERTREDPSS